MSEISDIKKDFSQIRDAIVGLQTSYAELAVRVEYPCSEHVGLTERLSRLEGCKAGANSARGAARHTAHLWIIGISTIIVSLTAILVAVLK